jgi:hypothetical protein
MVAWDQVKHQHVIAAIGEYDRLGQEEFLEKYHFGRARQYVLQYSGRGYDSKAILGVAYGHATGRPLSAQEFSGGRFGAAKILRRLGFIVSGP